MPHPAKAFTIWMLDRPILVILSLLSAACTATTAGHGPAQASDDLSPCDASARHADTAVHEARMFVEVSDAPLPQSGEGDWREVADLTEAKALAIKLPLSTQARVWDRRGSCVLASMYFTSDSGDWAQSVDYCFRPDGTLARTDSALTTFLADDGGLRRYRTRLYDRTGHVVTAQQCVVGLDDGKPRPDQRGIGFDEPVYPHRRSLPFAKLLQGAPTRR